MPALAGVVAQRAVLRDGAEIHYAEAGAGQPLVFVHGGMGDLTSWDPQWLAFTPRHRCISYSRRFSWPNRNRLVVRDHSVHREAADLAELLAAWNARPAVVVGTSYGAYTALQLALVDPTAVRALALTEPPVLPFADQVPGGREARLRFEREVLEPSNRAFEAGDAQLAVRLLTAGINGSGAGEASTAQGLARRTRNAEAMRALALSNQPYPALDEAALSRLKVPILLLRGERTEPIHRATFAALSGLLAEPVLDCIADAGHGVHRDNPGAFNERVLRFLASLPPGP